MKKAVVNVSISNCLLMIKSLKSVCFTAISAVHLDEVPQRPNPVTRT